MQVRVQTQQRELVQVSAGGADILLSRSTLIVRAIGSGLANSIRAWSKSTSVNISPELLVVPQR